MQQSVEESTSLARPSLPPIHLEGLDVSRDQEFVNNLVHSATQELEELENHIDGGPHKQRYSVFRDTFGQVG